MAVFISVCLAAIIILLTASSSELRGSIAPMDCRLSVASIASLDDLYHAGTDWTLVNNVSHVKQIKTRILAVFSVN